MRLDFVYVAAAGGKRVVVGGANTLYTEGDLRVAAASINTAVLDTVIESNLRIVLPALAGYINILGHCATSRKAEGSIPGGVIRIFH